MADQTTNPRGHPADQEDVAPDEAPAMQKVLERMMKDLVQVGSYDAIFLFDAEGLPIAKHVARTQLLHERHAVELSVLIGKMQKVIRRMSALGPLREVMIEDEGGRKLVFRYLYILSQTAILVMVVPPHRTYRGLINRLCRTVQKVSPNHS
ncbi:roadblock/LC7 domain-containing protein [candidate division KSB1 bacterium]|nr:roadblock/LC7 domain-containing protein [candidate division KSB1 bacterium]